MGPLRASWLAVGSVPGFGVIGGGPAREAADRLHIGGLGARRGVTAFPRQESVAKLRLLGLVVAVAVVAVVAVVAGPGAVLHADQRGADHRGLEAPKQVGVQHSARTGYY